MHSLSSLATALVIARTVIATPLNKIKERNIQFSLHQTLNPNFKGFYTTGEAAIAKVYAKYAKYGAVIPEDVSKAVSAAIATTQGTVLASPERYDKAYLSPVSIGTPAQVLNLDFDTGSADLWVFSTETFALNVNGQTLYNPDQSSTARLLWDESCGASSGFVYTDLVNVGGISFAGQAVQSAATVSSDFTHNTACDGMFGLAFSKLSTVSPTKQKTFFANVQDSLASPLFTIDLKYGTPGTYDFGFIDNHKYTGSIGYTSINKASGHWSLTSSGYAVGTGSFVNFPINAIADTGSSLLLLPPAIVAAYYAQVSGAVYFSVIGGYHFPCSATLPSFTFGIGSYRGTIPGKYINYSKRGNGFCYGGIQENTGMGTSIFGDVLLKAQFVIYDTGNSRIGFAAKSLT